VGVAYPILKPTNTHAFALLEVIVAMALMSLSTLTWVISAHNSLQGVKQSITDTQVLGLAQEVVETEWAIRRLTGSFDLRGTMDWQARLNAIDVNREMEITPVGPMAGLSVSVISQQTHRSLVLGELE
jgi:Tfp pilus assembly protein PilV